MSSTLRAIVMLAAGTMLAATPAPAQSARHPHRHHRYAAAQPYGGGEPYGYGNAPYPQSHGGSYGAGGWEADTIARLTAQAYREPGLALELEPSAKQSATGGPSGGLPGRGGS